MPNSLPIVTKATRTVSRNPSQSLFLPCCCLLAVPCTAERTLLLRWQVGCHFSEAPTGGPSNSSHFSCRLSA